MKITNKKQFLRLIEAMEENPSLAKGLKLAGPNFSKDSYTKKWEEIKEVLNSLGPPFKTSAEWQKVNSKTRYLTFNIFNICF